MAHRAADGTRGMSDFSRELARLMAARGIGVRQLARAVYVNPGHISNLRNGKARPSPGLAAELDRYLGAGGDLEDASLRSVSARSRGDAGTPEKRPRSAHLLDVGPQPWELADTLTRSSLSMTAVGFMEESITSLAARYPFTPPADLIPSVQNMLKAVNDALGRPQPLSVRARCVRLAGILCGVAGQLADDTARPDQSATWFNAAHVAADETGDPDLAAWLFALRSIGCHFRGEYELSAPLLDRATAAASSSTPRRQAWLATLSARSRAAVAAQHGDRIASKGEVVRTLDDARRYLQAAGPPSDTDFFDGPRLAGMAGGTMLLLGDTRAARTLIAEALAGRATGDAKGRALLTLDLAECMATEREPEQAADLCARAIGMTGGNVVLPVMTRAATVHSALQPWSRTRAVLAL
jgi:transcriptional regulator with XRE-family HTH domain